MLIDQTLERQIGGDRPVLLDTEEAWLIVKGRVDVFVVPLQADGGVGTRTHICRLENGAAFFGAQHASEGRLRLLAVGSSGTTLRPLRLGADDAWKGSDTPPDELVPLLDTWIRALYAGVCTEVPAAPCVEADMGRMHVKQPGMLLRTKQGLGWVRHVSGRSRIMGKPALEVGTSEFAPVSRRAWLTVEEPGVVEVVDTAHMLLRFSLWQTIARAHEIALMGASLVIEQQNAAALQRLRHRRVAAQGALSGALARVASTLRGATTPVIATAGTDEAIEQADVLFAAMRLVTDAGGIRMDALPPRSLPTERDQVGAIAKASRFRTRQVALREGWWREDRGPLLAYIAEDKRPVAIIQTAPGVSWLQDPVRSGRTRVTEEVAATLAPLATSVYRSFPEAAITLYELLAFGFRGCRRDIATLMGVSVASSLLALAGPLATAQLFNSVIPGAQRGQLVQLVALLLVSAVATVLFQLTRTVALLRINGRMGSSLQAAVWDRLLSVPLSFFKPYTAGNLAMRALGVDQARQIVFGSAVSAILSGVFSLSYIGLLFYYDVRLAWWALLCIGIALVCTSAISFLQLRSQRIVSEVRAKASGTVFELLAGITKLRVAGAESHAFAVWARLFSAQRAAQFTARRYGNWYAVFMSAFPIIGYIVIFVLVSKAAGANAMPTGDLLAFIAAFSACLSATLGSGGAAMQMLAAVPLFENAQPIFATLPEVQLGKTDPGALLGDIEMQHVMFRYGGSDAPLTLRDVSLHVRPGEFVAFVGPSGSGKSTIMRLLLGFDSPESGAVYFDGKDVEGLDVQALRRQIGVVLQGGRLSTGDIYTNIVGSSMATFEDAWEAARMAGFEADIRAMPMGMHTVVSEGGSTLSGGQRQRLMIARALVNRPRILLFDEATSALDNKTQAVVTESLARLQATRIVIAHRLSTITNADRIIVVEGGRIVQSGTYQQLITQPGLFAQLAQRQLA
ncbi:MAG: NHLP bacteriocin export ABC transporter permease/ATPase subunit [bacterium]